MLGTQPLEARCQLLASSQGCLLHAPLVGRDHSMWTPQHAMSIRVPWIDSYQVPSDRLPYTLSRHVAGSTAKLSEESSGYCSEREGWCTLLACFHDILASQWPLSRRHTAPDTRATIRIPGRSVGMRLSPSPDSLVRVLPR